jgi:hypothetical protein
LQRDRVNEPYAGAAWLSRALNPPARFETIVIKFGSVGKRGTGMEIAALTAFLAPFLPYLLRAGKTFGDEAAQALGEGAWTHAKRLWERLRPSVEGKPAASQAADDDPEPPDDERARGALELQLEKLLGEDADLAAEIDRLWADAKAAQVVVAGERGVAVAGNLSGTVVTGDQNVLRE